MKVLIGKTFGIGNCVMSVPMVRAIGSCPNVEFVDVLVGTGPDDAGSVDVFAGLQQQGKIRNIYRNRVEDDIIYDVAVMAIPFDRRWQEGRDFLAHLVLDCRRRPGDVDRLGLDMWEKHEAEYQMENARNPPFFFQGENPTSEFMTIDVHPNPNKIFLGLGFKRDLGGYGLQKHWGERNFSAFIHELSEVNPNVEFCATEAPQNRNILDVVKHFAHDVEFRLDFKPTSISDGFRSAASCCAFFGNDTGFSHVLASFGRPVFVMTPFPKVSVKNPPLGGRTHIELFGETPAKIAAKFAEFMKWN